MELPDDIYEQVEILSEAGNDAADDDDFEEAVAQWEQALALLPEPATQWEAYVWLKASIGDGYYHLDDFASAKSHLYDALNGPDGHESSFVHYLLGKTLIRLDDDKGVESLLKAYMLEGVDIFDSDDDEGAESLKILQDRGLIDED